VHGSLVPEVAAAQVGVTRLRIHYLAIGTHERAAERKCNPMRYVVYYLILHGEQVGIALFVGLRPDFPIVASIQQLSGNTDLLSRTQIGAFHDHVDFELSGSLADRTLHPFVLHDGSVGDHSQRRIFPQLCDQLVGHAVDEVILIRVRGQIAEG